MLLPWAALNEKGTAEAFVREAYEELGGLDLLVCNAGQSLVHSIYEMDEQTIDFLINLDFRSYLMAAREAGRIMGENGIKGNIIFISSCRGLRAFPYDELYGGLKAGLIRSIQTFALDSCTLWNPGKLCFSGAYQSPDQPGAAGRRRL